MSLAKLIQYTGPARANDGRLPVTEAGDGRVGLSTKGSRGPFIIQGVQSQGYLFKGFSTAADATLTPAQVVGANLGLAALGANRTYTLPSAAEIVSFIGSDLCQPSTVLVPPIAQTTGTGVSYLLPAFDFTVTFTDAVNSITLSGGTRVTYHRSGNLSKADDTSITALNTYPGVARFLVVITNATPGAEQVAILRNY